MLRRPFQGLSKRSSSALLSQLLGFAGVKHNLQVRPSNAWGFHTSNPVLSHPIPSLFPTPG